MWLGIGGALRVVAAGCVRGGGGLAGAGLGGGAGVEVCDVVWGAAMPGVVAGQGCEAEVAAEFGDDFGDGAGAEVVVEVGGVHTLVQLGVEGVGGVAFVGAVDGVLDFADDAPAGGGAVPGRVAGGWRGGVEAAGEEDAAADGAGDAVEGGGEWDEGVCGWGAGREGGRRVRGLGWWGVVGVLGSLSGGTAVQEAGEVGAHADQVAQGLAVLLRVRGGLAGVVLVFGWDRVR